MDTCAVGETIYIRKKRRFAKLFSFKKDLTDNITDVSEHLQEELLSSIDGLVIAYKSVTTGDNPIEDSVLRIDDALDNTNTFIKSVLGTEKRNFSNVEVKKLTDRVVDYTKRLVAVGLDPHTILENESISESYRFALNRIYRSDKGDFMGVGKKYPLLLKSFIVNRVRFFRKFRPAFEIISKKDRFKTYLLTGKTKYINDVQELVRKESTQHHLKEKSVNTLLPLLNGYNSRDADKLVGNAKEKNDAILQKFRERITSAADVDEDDVGKMVNTFLEIKMKWDILNFGIDYMSGKSDMPDKGSVIGFYNKALGMYSKIYQERRKYDNNVTDEYRINEVEEEVNDAALNGFNFKRGYIPGQGDPGSDFLNSGNMESKFPKLMRVLHHQKSTGDKANFVNGFIDSIMDFSYKIETVGLLTSLGAMKGSLNKYTEWGRRNPSVKNIITDYVDKMWKYTTDKKIVGHKTEIFRNFLHPLTMAAGPLMLLHPATGITNVLAGRLLVGLKLGKDVKTIDKIYQQALTNPSNPNYEIAKAVEAIAREEFLDTGTIQDFQIQKTSKDDGGSAMLRFSRAIHNGIVGIEDAATKKGLLGMLKLTDAFSLKNTEEKHLRNTIAPLLFDQAQIEIAVMKENGTYDESKSISVVVAEVLEKGGDNIHDDLKAALGHFDPENKPFWSWMGVSSPNAGKVAIGSLLNAWYQFKHVAVNNLYAMKDLAVEGDPFKRKGSRDMFYREYLSHLDTPSGGSLFILLAIAGLRAAAFIAGLTGSRKKLGVVFPIIRNINPLQEIQTMSELGLSIVHKHFTAPLLNLPVNEQEFEYIMRENLQLAGGVIAGGSLDDMIDKQYKEKPLYSAYMDGVSNNIMAIGDAFSAESYIERRQAVFAALNNPHPLTNYSNDFLSLASRIFLQLSPISKDETPDAYGNSPADKDQYKKNQDLGKALQVISGINWYTHPALWEKITIGSGFKLDYVLRRMQTKRAKSGFNDMDEEIYHQMNKYGHVYFRGMVEKMVQGE